MPARCDPSHNGNYSPSMYRVSIAQCLCAEAIQTIPTKLVRTANARRWVISFKCYCVSNLLSVRFTLFVYRWPPPFAERRTKNRTILHSVAGFHLNFIKLYRIGECGNELVEAPSPPSIQISRLDMKHSESIDDDDALKIN